MINYPLAGQTKKKKKNLAKKSLAKKDVFNPKNAVPTVNHNGGSTMWGCLSANGPGNLVRVERIIKKCLAVS